MPSATARRPHAPVIQRRSDGAERGRARRLYQFAMSSDGHGGTLVTDPPLNQQSFLSMPHA
jgi:hypothetical protein